MSLSSRKFNPSKNNGSPPRAPSSSSVQCCGFARGNYRAWFLVAWWSAFCSSCCSPSRRPPRRQPGIGCRREVLLHRLHPVFLDFAGCRTLRLSSVRVLTFFVLCLCCCCSGRLLTRALF